MTPPAFRPPPGPTRRHCLVAAAGAGLVGLAGAAGCALPRPAWPAPGRIIGLGGGAHLIAGAPGPVSPANLGRVGNTGFVVGPDGVLVIDTGTSYRHGRALLDTIARVTPRPVRAAYISRARQEALSGARAFRERGIPLHMHADAADLMFSRCEGCLKTLRQVLGEPEMHGSALVQPDVRFRGSHVNRDCGRPIEVIDSGGASGSGDVALFDREASVLYAGGLADADRIPDIQDGDLPRWHAALDTLAALAPHRVVPGHGPSGGPEVLHEVGAYLDALTQRIQGLLRDGVGLGEVPEAATLPRYAGWDQYRIVHRRNASVLYLRLERDLLFGPETAGKPR